MKKGQGLSMNVIIIAAIALLVLVILSVLVLRSGGKINDNTNSCTGKGQCYAGTDGKSACPEGTVYMPIYTCDSEGQYCCVKLTNKNS